MDAFRPILRRIGVVPADNHARIRSRGALRRGVDKRPNQAFWVVQRTLFALAFFGYTQNAVAYQPFLTETGKRVHWESLIIPIEIGDDPADLAHDAAVETIQAAMLTWQSLPCHPLNLLYVGEPKGKFYAVDGHNRILWMNGLWPGSPAELALTVVTHDEATGQIVDADILMNDAGFLFGTAGFDDPLTYDLAGTITHELGHLLGLDHSQKADATMTSEIDILTVGSLSSLHPDDIVGLCSLYEPRPLGTGRQSGHVRPDLDGYPHRQTPASGLAGGLSLAFFEGFTDWVKNATVASVGPSPTGMISAMKQRTQADEGRLTRLAVWIGLGAIVVCRRSRFFFIPGVVFVLTYFHACEPDEQFANDNQESADKHELESEITADMSDWVDTLETPDTHFMDEAPEQPKTNLTELFAQQACWAIKSVTTRGFYSTFGEVSLNWPDTSDASGPRLRFEPDGRLRQQWQPTLLEPDNGCTSATIYTTDGDKVTWTTTTASTYCPGEQNDREETWTAVASANGELELTLTSSAWELGTTGRLQQPATWVLAPCNDFSPEPCPPVVQPVKCELSCHGESPPDNAEPAYFLSCSPHFDAASCTQWATSATNPQVTEQKCKIGCYEVVCSVDLSVSSGSIGGCKEERTGISCSYGDL